MTTFWPPLKTKRRLTKKEREQEEAEQCDEEAVVPENVDDDDDDSQAVVDDPYDSLVDSRPLAVAEGDSMLEAAEGGQPEVEARMAELLGCGQGSVQPGTPAGLSTGVTDELGQLCLSTAKKPRVPCVPETIEISDSPVQPSLPKKPMYAAELDRKRARLQELKHL